MADHVNIAELVENIQADVTTIVRGEIELAKAELIPQAKSAGIGAGLFGGAAYLALTGSILLILGVGFGVALIYQTLGLGLLAALLLGFASVAVVFFILAVILVLVGKGKFKFSKPEKTIESVEQSVAAVKSAVTTGNDQIAAAGLLPKK
ncbi:MAG: phage holin family protein [Propionibacteriaceae bacterium]|jgi:membrane protein implicated in regulation of membrane protease activity|nr:phage holin family protein [Propionibacteriaceae bacterium]